MVKLLEANQVDIANEEVDAVMTADEEAIARQRFARTENPGDLSDGGMVSGARIRPMQANGRLAERGKPAQGRPAARMAWMWNGTESVLPLAWNPDGTVHDGARRYLLKRHCLCCNESGFRGMQCPVCAKKQCTRCGGSTEPKKIIPCFYLHKKDVPFPSRFYGNISCFLPSCIRTGDRGFLTEEEMRMHARSRHRMEYQAYVETKTAARADQVEILQRRVDELLSRGLAGQSTAVQAAPQTPAQERMARARAARKPKAAVGVA